MSLTTAISDDEIDRSGSPASTRPINSAASFNCTGAVRKAGFLSVKKWLIRKKHKVSIYLYNLYSQSLKITKKSLIFDSKSNNKTFWYFWRENSNSIFKQKKATVGFEVWRENSNMNIFSDIWIFAPKIKNKTIWYFWRENSNFIFEPKKNFKFFTHFQIAKRDFFFMNLQNEIFSVKCDILSYFHTMWGVCISLSLEKLRQNSGRKRFSFLYFFCTAGWVGQEARLERLLGVLERHNFTFLSLWVQRRSKCGSHTSASHYRRRIHYAEHSRASKERLHFLLIDGLWRCLSLPGNCEWRPKRKGNSEWVLNN